MAQLWWYDVGASVHVEMVKKKTSSMHEVWGTHCIIDALIVSHLGSIMSHSLRFLALFQDLWHFFPLESFSSL